MTNSPYIDYFNELKIQDKDFIPQEYMNYFHDANVIVLNGTWGSDLRKRLYMPKDFSYDRVSSGELLQKYRLRSAAQDVLNSHWVDLARKHNKKVVVFESRTISRAEDNYRKTDHKANVRISLDSWIYEHGKWLTPNDFDAPRLTNAERLYDHSWNINENGSIYIFTGLEIDPTSTMPINEFLESSIKTIRKHTERRIKIKIHPVSKMQKEYQYLTEKYKNIKFLSSKQNISEMYEDMYCAVINNSTSIFELIDAGIPTYCARENFGRDLKNTDLNTINSPYLASKQEVLGWVNNMSCTEIPSTYFETEEASYYVEKLVRKYS
jgi:hypothetical protein